MVTEIETGEIAADAVKENIKNANLSGMVRRTDGLPSECDI
jgi:hypothetical protein